MTPKAQQAAIVHACGWKLVVPPQGGAFAYWEHPHGDRIEDWERFPDYLNDLNAARDAIFQLVLHGRDIIQYRSNEKLFQDELDKLVEREQVPVWHFDAALYMEALLKTLNLWDSTK